MPNSVDWSVSQLSRQVSFPTQPTGPRWRGNSAIAFKQCVWAALVSRKVSSPTQSTGRFPNSVDKSVSQLSRQDRPPPFLFKSKMPCMQANQPQPLTYYYTYCYMNWQMTRCRAGPRLRANSAIALEQYIRLVTRKVSSPTQSTGRFPNSVDWSVSQLSRQDRTPPIF